MHAMKNVVRGVVVGATLLPLLGLGAPVGPVGGAAAPATTPSDKEASALMDQPWNKALPDGRLNIGLHFGDQQTEGFGDILLPVVAFKSGLLFINPRGTWNDDDGQEFNLGLGYRHLFPRQNIIAGANVYYDVRNTALDNTFNQLGAGLEFLSTWVDARANVYLPEKSKKVSDSYAVAEGTVQEYGSYWESPTGMGHEITQYGYEVNNTYDVKSLLHYQMTEQAMPGFDAEVGALLPLPVIRNFADVKVFGGVYNYNAHYGNDIAGAKGRLEIRPLPSLYLDAAWYEDRDLIGSKYSLGVRASLPFDLANLSRGKNPFAGALEGFKPGSVGKVPFAARLTDMVMRDLHVRTDASQPEEVVADRKELEKTLTASNRKDYNVVLASDVTFVDDDNRSGKEDGSWENPYRQINTGVQRAIGTMVYVRDAAQQYYENVILRDGLTLWGSGAPIYGQGNRFLGGIYPVVNGMGTGPAITLANRNVVAGFEIIQPSFVPANPAPGGGGANRTGIYGENVTDVTLLHNYIHGPSVYQGIQLFSYSQPELRATISDNTIQGVTGSGIEVLASAASLIDLTMANNRITGCSGDGIFIMANNNNAGSAITRISGVLSGNELMGANVSLIGFDQALAFFVDTEANNNHAGGMMVVMAQDNMSAALFASHEDLDRINQLVNTVLQGIPLLSGLAGSAVDVVDMLGLRGLYRACGSTVANGNGGAGITVIQTGVADLALTGLLGVQADGNGALSESAGVNVQQVGLLQDAVTLVARTQASGNSGNGILVNSMAQDLSLNLFMDVKANGNGLNGILSTTLSPEGMAGTVVFSSDPLVSLVESLSASPLLSGYVSPMDLSYIPRYGQVQANNNGGDGIMIMSQGTNVAFALVLDAQVNSNGQDPAQSGNGIEIDNQSDGGMAISAVGSSEALVNLAAPILQGLSIPLDLSGVQTLGPLQANGNRGAGVSVLNIGQDSSIAVVGGVEALANGFAPFHPAPSHPEAGGVDVTAVSHGNTAAVGLGWINASDNRGSGIQTIVRTDDINSDAMLGAIHITADRNAAGGFFANVASAAPDSSYAVLAGVEANENGAGGGINLVLTGPGAEMAALSGITANGNVGNGVSVQTTSDNGGSHVWISSTAIQDMITHGGGIDLGGLDVASLLPTGAIETRNNTGSGVYISASSPGGSILVDVGDATTTGNSINGVFAAMDSHDDINASFHDIDTTGSAGGVAFTTNSISGTVTVNLSGIVP